MRLPRDEHAWLGEQRRLLDADRGPAALDKNDPARGGYAGLV